MTTYVLTLDEIEPHAPTLAGGKAANVAELRRAGLRVPERPCRILRREEPIVSGARVQRSKRGGFRRTHQGNTSPEKDAEMENKVVFRTRLDEHGEYVPNNFVVTAWANYIQPKR